jgi:SWI/SNF-related matrix-associated actin-dependent regulator of chromatin subfamily A3
MLVYTPKGNVPVVGNYLKQCNLFLGEPSLTYGIRLANYHYFNPHTPSAGRDDILMTFNPLTSPPERDHSRWTTPIITGKNIDVQRSQVDELFKSLKDEDELIETEPCAWTQLVLMSHLILTF